MIHHPKRLADGDYAVHAPVSPAKMFELELVDIFTLLQLHESPNVTTYIGVLADQPGNLGLCSLVLPISRRTVQVNPRYVGTAEKVALWRATCHHQNNSFTSPIVEYFLTHPEAELESVKDHTNDRTVRSLFGIIQGENF